jgi:hypothetical protein
MSNSEDIKNISRYIYRQANLPEPTEKINTQTGNVKSGKDNLYPQFLNRLYYENPVHGGIINQKVKFITAGGLTVEGGDAGVLDNNSSAYTLEEVIDSICRDFEIGETQDWHWKKNPVSGAWFVEPMDYELIRVNEDSSFYEYSEDWSKSQQNQNTGYRRIPNIHYLSEEDSECIMHVITRPKQRSFEKKQLGLTANYYPAVNYSGAITDILAAIEMSFFTYSEVVNGWKGGTLINLANGRPQNDEQRKLIEKELKINASDRDKQGGMIITYSDGKDRQPMVEQISGNDLDKRYDQAKKTTTSSIMVAHGVISPALFGVFTESMFGSKEEMETAYLLFKENYVEVRQRQLLNPLNWALKRLNGFTGKVVFNDYIPSILQEQNIDSDNLVAAQINGMSPLVATKVLGSMTANEIRALAKLPSKLGGDTIIKSEFSDQSFIKEFSKFGTPRSEVNILYSQAYTSYEDNEEQFKADYKKSKFQVDLTDNQKSILTMINGGESYNAIKNALDITGRELSTELVRLGNLNVLNDWNVTEIGRELTLPEQDFKVLYSYEKRIDAPDLVEGGSSRPFCETLIALDRLYTREEINTISSNVKRDVWSYRGGWYHNPETDINTPSCRHTWVQNISL